ncbi:MAG: 1-phosphofructokinase [Clostridia bacterium]|jgi:1-phosphofructokinase|nr:1-phosphofructokinase [Clostridia bacterium]
MIITVTLNPAVDKVMVIKNFKAGSVNRASEIMVEAGGKGINVSKTISSLGGISKAFGILAGQGGSFIENSLDILKIEHEFLYVAGETRTNVKISDPINNIVTDINEPGPVVSKEVIEKLSQELFENMNKDDVLVLTGSTPQGVDKDIYKLWIETAKTAGIRCILDADGELLKNGIEAGPYLVKPNIHEIERLYQTQTKNMDEVIELAKRLLVKGTEMAAVSCGEKGAVFVTNSWVAVAEGIKTTVKSTVGAGDAMVAALSYGVHEKLEPEEMIKLAVACGTATVMIYGNQPSEADINSLKEQVNIIFLYK